VVDLVDVSLRPRGRQCSLMPISYQTVSISGTREEIDAQARRLLELLGPDFGRFIGYLGEYGCMGMSEPDCRASAKTSTKLEAGRQTDENC